MNMFHQKSQNFEKMKKKTSGDIVPQMYHK